MTDAPLKAMARTRDLKAGHFLFEFTSPGYRPHPRVRPTATSRSSTPSTAASASRPPSGCMRYMHGAGMPTVVRVPSKDYKDIARALRRRRRGRHAADGRSTVEEAEGDHPFDEIRAGGRPRRHRALRPRPATPPGRRWRSWRQTPARVLFAQIETADGVENADGHRRDRRASTASGSAISTCPVRSASRPSSTIRTSWPPIDTVLAACDKHGKSALGRLVPDVDSGIALLQAGLRLHRLSADAWALGRRRVAPA